MCVAVLFYLFVHVKFLFLSRCVSWSQLYQQRCISMLVYLRVDCVVPRRVPSDWADEKCLASDKWLKLTSFRIFQLNQQWLCLTSISRCFLFMRFVCVWDFVLVAAFSAANVFFVRVCLSWLRCAPCVLRLSWREVLGFRQVVKTHKLKNFAAKSAASAFDFILTVFCCSSVSCVSRISYWSRSYISIECVFLFVCVWVGCVVSHQDFFCV